MSIKQIRPWAAGHSCSFELDEPDSEPEQQSAPSDLVLIALAVSLGVVILLCLLVVAWMYIVFRDDNRPTEEEALAYSEQVRRQVSL